MLTNMLGSENDKIKRIERWRENLSTLPDERFFDIIRVYLGEIHTPFNKQRLIEQLSAFFRKEQTKANIETLLSDFDIKIITAVSVIPNPTRNKIVDFLSSEYSLSEIYTELFNLSERLILFSDRDSESSQPILVRNPLLDDVLNKYINIGILLPPVLYAERTDGAPFLLSPLFIAAFVSYIAENPDMCKNDGSIKKNHAVRLEDKFPGRKKSLQLLLNAFVNLGLVKQGEKELSVDERRFQIFAEMQEAQQNAYFCVASCCRLGREGLRLQTQLLLDVAETIPPEGFSRSSILRAAVLLSSRHGNAPVQSRFSRLLEANREFKRSGVYNAENDGTSAQIMDSIVDSAVEFGVFVISGKTEKGEDILTAGPVFTDFYQSEKGGGAKALNINAGMNVTLLPGFTLKELLPLISFMSITNCNTAAEFEITRCSAVRAFDKGLSPDQICAMLAEYTEYDIPKNLRINIEDWYNSYSSAMLYKGYVLKLNEKNALLAEKNPNISAFIQEKLAPGLYLLNIPPEGDISNFTANCGFDFLGSIKTADKEVEKVSFPLLSKGTSFFAHTEETYRPENTMSQAENENKSAEFIAGLHAVLDKMEITRQQKECLAKRIDSKIIISDEQLRANTVRLEILEAGGMDYMGKVRLAENAVLSGDMIEITVPADNDACNMLSFLGTPLLVIKQGSEGLIKMQLEPSKEVKFYSISKANNIRIIKTSVF